jgi:TetR/AcrR family transcriptional regulator, transcriptional repressor of aconitase
MPKVSEEHKQRRRGEILEGAQRAFARHGYEGATVARLEEETGLSRGAIFNYFDNKEALFVALVKRSSDRFVEIWLTDGFRALLDAIADADADWLAVLVEAIGRVRTDEGFRKQVARLDAEARTQRGERQERLRAAVREDVPIHVTAQYLSLVANGLAFARASDEPMPDLDALMTLVETGVAPRK